MKKFLKEMYGVGILFFYYLKWPLVLGLPVLYLQLDYPHNPIMDVLWVYSVLLIVKDFYTLLRARNDKKLL